MNRGYKRAWLLLLALAVALEGCNRKDSKTPKNTAASNPPSNSALPAQKPEYTFAAGLQEKYPDVTAFIRHFLETCLAGDYNGYRQLVSRRRDPESKERFLAIYRGIQAVTIDAIDPVDVSDLPAPTYRVVSEVRLDPNQKVALRGPHRKIAILAFKEEGEWRIVPAPSKHQPQDEAGAPEAEPTATAPAYPWDEEGP